MQWCHYAGAQKEGAAGFFKGVGKGLVGAVARPTGGIIDMASSTFQGIKRYGYFCLCRAIACLPHQRIIRSAVCVPQSSCVNVFIAGCNPELCAHAL